MTVEELRQKALHDQIVHDQEQKRLQKKVLCVELTLPLKTQNALGLSGFTMKLSELVDYLENDFENDERGIYTIKVTERTNKWIENLPEADI